MEEYICKKCGCGTELEIEQSKRAAFCPKCDRAPVNIADDMKEFGYSIEAYAKDMRKVLKEWDKFYRKQCQGGCGRSFPKSEMHSGLWCSECYETKEETN